MERGLNSNQLKLIAMITMTIDHMGLMLFPDVLEMRMIGRLAYPIYAYLIAEGCRHTRSMGRYLGSLAAVALVCQLAYFFAMERLDQCIMVTFSLSVSLVWLLRWSVRHGIYGKLVGAAGIFAVLFITEYLPELWKGSGFSVDYGFIGAAIPVVLYACRNREQKLMALAVLLGLMSAGMVDLQWLSLMALLPLMCYNGQRGNRNLKWIFYLYYPVHLLALEGLTMIL